MVLSGKGLSMSGCFICSVLLSKDTEFLSGILAWVRNSHLTNSVTCGLFIGCIGTHTDGRQVTSMFSQSDVII